MGDSPFYDELSRRHHYDVPEQPHGQDLATTMLPAIPATEPVARTAGEQDHTNPWRYAEDPANPPENP